MTFKFSTQLHRFIPRLFKSRLPRMTFQDVVAKLSTPVKDLVINMTENGTRYLGESPNDQAEVTEWIEKAGKPDLDTQVNLQVRGICRCARYSRRLRPFQSLNSSLVPRTYLVNNYLTAADVAMYGALHPTFVGASMPLFVFNQRS